MWYYTSFFFLNIDTIKDKKKKTFNKWNQFLKDETACVLVYANLHAFILFSFDYAAPDLESSF